jgi:hypothetical protein
MKKAIIILTCFIGVSAYSQINFDTTAISDAFKKVNTKLNPVYTYRPSRFFKLTMKPTLNYGQAYHLLVTNNDITTNDYFKVGKVDMRLKFYLHPKVSFIMGGQFSGTTGYNYTTGIVIKLN